MKKLNAKGCAAALAAVLAISSISLSVSAESGTRDTKEIKHSMTAENKIEDDVTVKIVSVDGSSVTAEIMMIGQPFNDDKEPDTDEKPDDLPDIAPQDIPEPIAADDEDRPAPDKDTPPEKPSEDEGEKPFDEGEMPKDMTVTFTLTSDTVYTDADGEKATSAIVTEDAVLTVVLVWASINVTNCSDGVDGLSGTLTIITLMTIFVIDNLLGIEGSFNYCILVFAVCLLGYLWYNATPSKLLMGDAGSRAMGIFIAIACLKMGSPILYLLEAKMLILDGG